MQAIVLAAAGALLMGAICGCSPSMQVRRVEAAEARSCERLDRFRLVGLYPFGQSTLSTLQLRHQARRRAWEMGGNAMLTTNEYIEVGEGGWDIVYEGIALKCDFTKT